MSRLARIGVGFAAFAAAAAPAAHADFGFQEFGAATGSGGQFSRQAGAHADLTTVLKFSGEENVRNIKVDLPPGLIGDPTVVDRCTLEDLIGILGANRALCPVTSQVGLVEINQVLGGPPERVGVYNMAQPQNRPALFGFNYQGVIVRIEPRLRASDYAISTEVRDISTAQLVIGSTLTLWGVPADPSHDAQRDSQGGKDGGGASPLARRPFLSNPTSCPDAPGRFTAAVESWQGGSVFSEVTGDLEGTPFQWEGCDKVPFDPSFEATPGSHLAATPTGLNVEIRVPQSENPLGLATAHVRKTVVTLPQGFAISPSAAAGQDACSQSQIGLGTDTPVTCPPASQLGTLDLKTPLLDDALAGDVYLARQQENPFGSMFAMYLVVRGPGILIKLAGKIETDPQTGQLTTIFDNLPQLPFEELSLTLRGGPKAALATPSACGTYQAKVEMASWASPDPVELAAPMAITEGCDTGGFDPQLRAGTSNPQAGAFSPFTLRVLRGDGEQNISRLQATLPEGLLAKLGGVPLCGEAQAATGDCPAASQVGRVTVAAGPGETPVVVPQPGKEPTAIYLAGPYKGAPYSLVVKVPAQAGPFDLGTVAIRNALHVDPVTTRATTTSDPLPQILQGIPIAYRDVQVEIDRPNFTVNPTSCDEQKITTTLTSAGGKTASPSSRFQTLGCDALGFKPKLALKFSGKTHRSAHPALKATLTMPKGGANIAKAVVLLPETEYIDNAHISNPCTRVQFDAGDCPRGSILGTAKAYTPLLDQPLSGPVYFRSNGGDRELPDLVADLHGPIHVTLVGFLDSVRTGPETARVRTRFLGVPDAPVSKFVLSMKGGDKGLIVNNSELCRSNPRAKVQLAGQNGKRSVSNPLIKLDCGKSPRKR